MKISGLHALALIVLVACLVGPKEMEPNPSEIKPWNMEVRNASIGWSRHLETEANWIARCSVTEGIFRRAGKQRAMDFLQNAISEVDMRSTARESAYVREGEQSSYSISSEANDGTANVTSSRIDAWYFAEMGLVQRRYAQACMLVGEREEALALIRDARRSYERAYEPGSRARMEATLFLNEVQARMELSGL